MPTKGRGSTPAAPLEMNDLANKKCVPCDGNIPPFDKSEIHKYLKKVDGWDVKNDENKSYYLFKSFHLEILKKVRNLLTKLVC